jgi:hypothetical protein
MNQLVPFTAHSASALVAASDERATMRFRNSSSQHPQYAHGARMTARWLLTARPAPDHQVKNWTVHLIICFTHAVYGGTSIGTTLNLSSRTARSCEKARKP